MSYGMHRLIIIRELYRKAEKVCGHFTDATVTNSNDYTEKGLQNSDKEYNML